MIYIYEYSESPDGIHSDLYLMKEASSIEEASRIYNDNLIKETEEYCGKDDFERQFAYLKDREIKKRVIILDVKDFLEIDFEVLKEKIAKDLSVQIVSEEKKLYEKLKAKYENENN